MTSPLSPFSIPDDISSDVTVHPRREQARALTIAGSDSGGGAGIQADLKTFAALGAYGCSVITALTAQNTQGVFGVAVTDPAFVHQQMRAVLSDIQPQAAKTGMLATRGVIEQVAAALDEYGLRQLVVDPVMVSKHGQRLLDSDSEDAMRRAMLPRCLLVTPNLPEAEVLTGMMDIRDEAAMHEACRRLFDAGARHVLVKGGHLSGPELVDVFFDGSSFEVFRSPQLATEHTHGTGCTLSAAITALVAQRRPLRDAIAQARQYLQGALRHPALIGQGIGPVNHLWIHERFAESHVC